MGKKDRKQSPQSPAKGMQTRHYIVDRALNIAAQEGLGALSIGRLAKELKMSKSGLFLHFGSKTNLELAVIERASLHFFDHIMVPIEEKGLAGIERVWALCDGWLDFFEQRMLPGGYFFTGAYFQCARQSGPVARQIRQAVRDWVDALEEALSEARRHDEVRGSVNANQVAVDIHSILIGAQWSLLMGRMDDTNTRSAILDRLRDLAAEEIPAHAFQSVNAWKAYLENRDTG